MRKLFWMLKPIDKVKLARLYKDLTGLDFVPPKEERHQAMVSQMEPLEELEQIMSESPNYVMTQQGRATE